MPGRGVVQREVRRTLDGPDFLALLIGLAPRPPRGFTLLALAAIALSAAEAVKDARASGIAVVRSVLTRPAPSLTHRIASTA